MLSARRNVKTGTRDGASAEPLSVEAVKLLKTQDAGYLGLVGGKVKRDKERVEREVLEEKGWSENGSGGKKMVFVDGKDGQKEVLERLQRKRDEENAVEDAGDNAQVEEAAQGQMTKSRKEIEAAKLKLREERAARKRRKRIREARLVQLDLLKKKEKDIKDAERELEWQRARMANKVGGVNKNGIKWKIRERKR